MQLNLRAPPPCQQPHSAVLGKATSTTCRQPFVSQRAGGHSFAAPSCVEAGKHILSQIKVENDPAHLCRASAASTSDAAVNSAAGVPAAAAAVVPPQPDAAEAVEWIEVGLIRSAHGVRGEMKVQPLTDFPWERLATPGTRWLQQPDNMGRIRNLPPPEAVQLEDGRPTISKGNEVWLVKLEGTDSPEEAELLKGCKLLIRRDEREPLEDEDEFYVQDLIGMSVALAATGQVIGRCVDMYDGTGTQDVMRVLLAAENREDEKTVLVPFVKEIVPSIDFDQQLMTIDPPEGLLETALPARRKRKSPRPGKRTKL